MEYLKIFNPYITKKSPIDISIVGESFCDKNFSFERECSDVMALEYIVSGSGTLEINGQILKPKAGDVFLLTKKSKHKYYCDAETPWHKYWVVFEGKAAQCLVDEYLPKDTYLFENTNLIRQFARLYDVAVNKDFDYKRVLDISSRIIFDIIVSLSGNFNSLSTDRAEMIREALDNMVESSFSLDTLSRKMNYSKNYIIRIFSEKYGLTPYKYYTHAKIETAKLYLLHSDETICEISNRLCYTDPHYFSFCFKQATGMTPREFRAQGIKSAKEKITSENF